MKKHKPAIPEAEATAEDAARVVSAYGKTPDPEKKAALLARLEAGRSSGYPKIKGDQEMPRRVLER